MACQSCPQHLWRPHTRKNCTAGRSCRPVSSQRPKSTDNSIAPKRFAPFSPLPVKEACREPQGGFPIIAGHAVRTDPQPSASKSWSLCDGRRSDGRATAPNCNSAALTIVRRHRRSCISYHLQNMAGGGTVGYKAAPNPPEGVSTDWVSGGVVGV